MTRKQWKTTTVLPVYHPRQALNDTDNPEKTRHRRQAPDLGNASSHRSNPLLTRSVESNVAVSQKALSLLQGPAGESQCQITSEIFFHKPPGRGVHWQNCFGLVANHDNINCQLHREEVDTLLVFAGLFSGVLAAFIIESYKWLMVQTDDIMADYLLQMLALMSEVDVSSITTTSRRSQLPYHVMARINGFWFSSLALSLTSALVGIVSKQWLREYLRDTGHSHKTNLAVRQVKFEGLKQWWVGAIISAIPLLLQTALFLFLFGVVDLLWHVQPTVAAIITTLCSSTMLFFALTTILPAVQYLCYHRGMRLHVIYQLPFKSPQAWLFMHGAVAVANSIAGAYAHAKSLVRGETKEHVHAAPYKIYESWTQFDLDWTQRQDLTAEWFDKPSALARCLGFMDMTFEHASLRDWIWNCLWEMRDRAVNAEYVLRCFRRESDEERNLRPLDDRLIQDVKAFLDPRGNSQPTSEAVLYVLLASGRGAPRADARLEHIVRIFNAFGQCSHAMIPQVIYDAVHTALQDAAKISYSSELTSQLHDLAQDLLLKDGATENDLQLASALSDLSLDLIDDVVERLEEDPIPKFGIDDCKLKSRVVWAARIAVDLAQRILQSGSLDVPARHPRFAQVNGLVQSLCETIGSVPEAATNFWSAESMILDELESVKNSLSMPRDGNRGSSGKRRRNRKLKRKDAHRTDSEGTLAQIPDLDTKIVHWNMPVNTEVEQPAASRTTGERPECGKERNMVDVDRWRRESLSTSMGPISQRLPRTGSVGSGRGKLGPSRERMDDWESANAYSAAGSGARARRTSLEKGSRIAKAS
ncbi:hypothetical protein HDZ31DRAFT_83852 [Schizophyllum fasciatum]